MKYVVTYLTTSGWYDLPSLTLEEAKADVKRLKELNKKPGNWAGAIEIKELV